MAVSKLTGASVRDAVSVVSNRGFVNIETRRIRRNAIKVKNEEESNTQQRKDKPVPAQDLQKVRRRRTVT